MNRIYIITSACFVAAVALAAWTMRNHGVIVYTEGANTPVNWSITGLSGISSIASLILGLVLQYRATGKVAASSVAEVAALCTLTTAAVMKADSIGMDMASRWSLHIKERDSLTPPSPVVEKVA